MPRTDETVAAAVAALAPLIEQAERERKWLWCNYQDIWVTPKQLRESNAKGMLLWSPENWKLRDPQEQLAKAKARTASAKREEDRIAAKIAANN